MIRRHPITFRSFSIGCLSGILLAVVVYISIWASLPLLGGAFEIFFFVPEQLGIVDRLKPNEKIEIGLAQEREVQLTRDGIHNVYTTVPGQIDYAVTVTSKVTGERVPVDYITRSWDADDEPVYPLRSPFIPVLEFDVPEPGLYNVSTRRLDEQSSATTLIIAPRVPPNSDLILILSVLVQCVILVVVGRAIYDQINYQFNKAEIEAAAVKQDKSEKMGSWLDGRKDTD